MFIHDYILDCLTVNCVNRIKKNIVIGSIIILIDKSLNYLNSHEGMYTVYSNENITETLQQHCISL